MATGWLGRVPALIGLGVGAVLAAVFEPKIVALLRRVGRAGPNGRVPARDMQPRARRGGRRWLLALATAIVSVVAVVTVIDAGRGRSLVGERERTFLPPPSQPVTVVRRVKVPAVANLAFDDAKELIEESGLEVDRREEYSEDVDTELVIRTEPGAGARLEKGRSVAVVVSGNDTTVPEVAGSTYDEAKALLEKAGLTAEEHEDVAAAQLGTVIRTEPPERTRVEEHSTVRVFVSAEGVNVPYVRGLPLSDAQDAVRAAGLVAGDMKFGVDATVPIGRVIGTDPEANKTVAKQTSVMFFVSSGAGPPPVTGPTENAPA